MINSEYWVAQLGLEPHPEGGYYRRIYESNLSLTTQKGKRVSATAIHYLLQANDFSAWHRIEHDELWFFHQGQPLTVHSLDANGELHSQTLGVGHAMSITIPGKTWFCAELTSVKSESDFALVSCVVSPGFDFADFELAQAAELSAQFPQHGAIIARLCRQ